MSAVLIDGFCIGSVPQTEGEPCVRTLVCEGREAPQEAFLPFGEDAVSRGVKRLYLPTLDLSDARLDALIEYALEQGAQILAECSTTLEEAGKIDSRFGKSPVMFLHECGILHCCTVVGGVYLDKDDLALMAQERVPLVVRPSFDAGNGRGVAPVTAAHKAGVEVRLGTADGTFNRAHSVILEAAYLRLLTAAQLNKKDALPLEVLSRMAAGEENESIVRRIATQAF